MDNETKEMLQTIIDLLKKIESHTEDIYSVKSEVEDVASEAKKIRLKLTETEE